MPLGFKPGFDFTRQRLGITKTVASESVELEKNHHYGNAEAHDQLVISNVQPGVLPHKGVDVGINNIFAPRGWF